MTWLKKRRKYSRPKKLYDKTRIEEENSLIKIYGLKNKEEIWKADAAIGRLRNRAKNLITASQEEQEKLFNRLKNMGFKVEKISDILGLDKEDWLKRRLQSVLVKKGFAKPREARQLIVHKHVAINSNIINVPGYIVKVDEEEKIKVFKKILKTKEEIKKLDEIKTRENVEDVDKINEEVNKVVEIKNG
tara:strand:- start:2800 stop:3366 length:567 start_codon:yes stop_codon:yes gene_type:complete